MHHYLFIHTSIKGHFEKTLMLGGIGAGGEGDDRGWDGWMASPTQWTWVWVNSGSWWWTGRPGMLQFMGSQRVGHNWETELNWTGCFQFVCVCERDWESEREYELSCYKIHVHVFMWALAIKSFGELTRRVFVRSCGMTIFSSVNCFQSDSTIL